MHPTFHPNATLCHNTQVCVLSSTAFHDCGASATARTSNRSLAFFRPVFVRHSDASPRRSAVPFLDEFLTLYKSLSMQLYVAGLRLLRHPNVAPPEFGPLQQTNHQHREKTLFIAHSTSTSRASHGMPALSSSFPSHWRTETCYVAKGVHLSFARLLSTTCKFEEHGSRFAMHVHGMGLNCGLAFSSSLCARLIHILAGTRRFVSRI